MPSLASWTNVCAISPTQYLLIVFKKELYSWMVLRFQGCSSFSIYSLYEAQPLNHLWVALQRKPNMVQIARDNNADITVHKSIANPMQLSLQCTYTCCTCYCIIWTIELMKLLHLLYVVQKLIAVTVRLGNYTFSIAGPFAISSRWNAQPLRWLWVRLWYSNYFHLKVQNVISKSSKCHLLRMLHFRDVFDWLSTDWRRFLEEDDPVKEQKDAIINA